MKLKCDEQLSNLAFTFNLRRYTLDDSKLAQLCQETVEAHTIVAFIKGTRKVGRCRLTP